MTNNIDTAATGDYSSEDLLIRGLRKIIHLAVKVLAILMTLVIVLGAVDVVYVLYQRIMSPPVGLLEISDIFATFGAFMAVLIAIEIFVNITVYLRDDVVHVKIVIATALMAIARKVIILEFPETTAIEAFAIAAVIISMSVAYWLTSTNAPKVPDIENVGRVGPRPG